MKVLNINWLDCDKCEYSPIEVSTEKGSSELLYEGDNAVCPKCKSKGVINVDEHIAYIVWE